MVPMAQTVPAPASAAMAGAEEEAMLREQVVQVVQVEFLAEGEAEGEAARIPAAQVELEQEEKLLLFSGLRIWHKEHIETSIRAMTLGQNAVGQPSSVPSSLAEAQQELVVWLEVPVIRAVVAVLAAEVLL